MVCSSCEKELSVRSDYAMKHSGICMSCQKKGNNNALKHGGRGKRIYGIWAGLKHRKYTYVPTICNEWKSFELFEKWAMSNGYKDNLTIDRKKNEKGYSPENCQWISHSVNSGKDKILFSDEEKIEVYFKRKKLEITQVEMAKLLNVSRNTIQRAEKFAKRVKK